MGDGSLVEAQHFLPEGFGLAWNAPGFGSGVVAARVVEDFLGLLESAAEALPLLLVFDFERGLELVDDLDPLKDVDRLAVGPLVPGLLNRHRRLSNQPSPLRSHRRLTTSFPNPLININLHPLILTLRPTSLAQHLLLAF